MANEVVKFNNDMNTVALRKFNSTEINLLMSICSRVRDQDLKYVEFDFNYLKTLIKYPYNDINSFVNTLDSAYNKLLKCNIRIGNDIKWTRFVLFTKYTIDVENQTVTIGVNEEFKYVLNELTSNFTRFELEEFVDFKSTYTKEFYRRMKQFRSTGFWKCNIEEFRNLLDIPEKYRIVDIDKYVLKPVVKELGEKYNLQIEKKYGFNGGRGRSRVIGFEFRFSTDKNLETLETKKIEKEVKPQKRYKIIENTPKVEEKEKTLSEQIKEELEMEQEALNRSTTLLGAYIAGLKDITNNSIIIDSKRRINLRKEKIEKLEQFSNLADDEIDESLEKVIQKVLEMEIK